MGRVLVGFDGSEPSRRALAWAVARGKATGDELILLTVIPPSVANSSLAKMMPAGVELPPTMARTFEESARERLDEVVNGNKASGVKLRGEVRSGEALRVFMEAAKELDVQEIVVGNKSFERDALKLGPIAERLVRHMPATVTVVR